MSAKEEVNLAGPRRQPDSMERQRRRLSMAHTVQVARTNQEVTPTRKRALTLVGEQGAIAADQLADLLEIEVPEALRLAYELKQVAWVGTEELIPGRYPWLWLRAPGTRRSGLELEGGRPDPAETPYLWAANAARIYFAEEFADARWVSRKFLERDYRASRLPEIPAAVLEIGDEEGFIQRHAVEVRWSKDKSDAEPDLDFLEELLADHVERYEAVDYFCPENVFQLMSEVGFEELYETLTVHGLEEPAKPDPVSDELVFQLAKQALPSLGGNAHGGGIMEGRRRAVRIEEPIVVYEIESSALSEKALHAIAETAELSSLPQVRGAWKKDGGGNHLYCVDTDAGIFRVSFSGWGWRADGVVDEGVFEKRPPKPPSVRRQIVSHGEKEIDDALWAKIEPLLPGQIYHWAKQYPQRTALAGIICLLRNRMRSWSELTSDLGFGTGSRCLRRLRHWEDLGVWDKVEQILRRELPDGEELDWSRLKLSKGQKLPRDH
jgi:transposase